MDRFIRSLFLLAGFREKVGPVHGDRLALVALGSYGRRELCLGSDVDLLVIHQGRLSPEMTKIIPLALYPLWDAKLQVGHSVLTVQESLRLAMNDFRFLTSVVDARFLMGSRAFYRLFEVAFWPRIDREKGPLLKQFLISQRKREEKYSGENYFVEPDIKEGLGGLRDLHFMGWMARIYFKSKSLSDVKRFPVFSHFDLDKLRYSESFLLKVRNQLHLLADGRREDRLLLPFQEKISHSLGYQDGLYNTGPERFMKNVYLHLNRIRYGSEEFQVKALDIIDPKPFEPTPDRLPPEFRVMKGNIVFKGESLLEKDPFLILKAFDEANRRGLFLGSGFLWEARKKIAKEGKELSHSPKAKELFLSIILNPKNPKIIRLALEIGLISLFIPEYKKIRNLAQFSYYHVETVDLHSLRILEVLQKISRGAYDDRWPLFKESFSELEHPELVFLAGLLHDIGKGYRGDHSQKGAQLIPRILKRFDITGDAHEVILFLVKHHLLLMRISQRRDLNEEKTSIQLAQDIQNTEVLNSLFLLTVADSISTGPIASSDWKIMLLIELFFKVRRILEKETFASPDATKRREDNKKMIRKRLELHFPREDILDLMDQISPRYFLNTPPEDMAEHFRLALTIGEEKLSWTLRKLEDAPVTRVILCTYDRPGLFSKMAGVFALNNIDVLSANIFTLKNGLAFDIYDVTNPLDPYREKERWHKIHTEAMRAMEDKIPLEELINRKGRMIPFPKRDYTRQKKDVDIDNEVSDFFTIIEVSAGQRVGLLYELAKEIFSLELDIRFAKVNSDEERMTGVFYIRDSGGQKILEEDQIQKIKMKIMSVIG
jgi:[protein-PII] uridylyltransferase